MSTELSKPEKVWLDFETYSTIDLKKAGSMTYCRDDSTNVICLGYAIDDGPVKLWNPSKPEPIDLLEALEQGAKFIAHNAVFDLRVWNYVCNRDFDWPVLSLDQVIDTMAVCASFSLPLSLAEAGAAMNITMPKNKEGAKLIKALCSPNKKGGQPLPHDPVYSAQFERFFVYCVRDVESMREVIESLPRQELIPQEHEVWKLTCNMNHQGLPVSYDEATTIRDTIDKYIKLRLPEIAEVTDNIVTTVNQHARIKKFCSDNNYPMANTQANTLVVALADKNCVSPVRDLLQLRTELGSAATAKFKKLLELTTLDAYGNYWIHDNLVYHGAGPGRWTAKGFQMQNLPRAKFPDPEPVIEQFIRGI